ncbi:serine/threonine protein kinase [Acanthopleuribacter pedis]|uniref:Protein kinase n=1 Tax=Acanthopleuribacter pedis TaxID=442870 RepID=A0A8J7QGQ7_9BACT|nr:serine/threonine-protein kinase [Acanthopleuribacter pedis]MBO1320051.1 protein kinase [Acanthopleuribacter pedis]
MIKTLGKYDIIEVLGRGSMGVVYKAIDPRIGKVAAVKTMNQRILKDPALQERFYREGAILGQLQHRNIINVYNVGVDGDICYIAMEYLEGISLEQLLKKEKRISPTRAVDLVRQVCEGVSAAHRQSIIHRDLKPANIYICDDDHVKVLDFGVASFQDSRLTNSGVMLGTINYMAPEQITGVKVDYRSDIFSVGVILYELLSGVNPFLGRNISQTMVRLVNENPLPIPGLPGPLQNVLNQALVKEREKRYRGSKLMGADLEQVLRKVNLPDEPYQLPRENDGHAEMVRKMLEMRIETIRRHIKAEDFDLAEEHIRQLKRVEGESEAVVGLRAELAQALEVQKQKKQFAIQLTLETLNKAGEHMARRHYVLAVELCDKVLKLNPRHQDALAIRANALKKMGQFLEKAKNKEEVCF